MDKYVLARINLTNLLTQAVKLHDEVAHATDDIDLEYNDKDKEVTTALRNAGPIFKKLKTLYTVDIRNACIVFEYLAGHDLFSISNDFKLSRNAIKKILVEHGIDIIKQP